MFIRPINNTRDGFNFVKRIKTSMEKLIDLFNRLSSRFDRYRIIRNILSKVFVNVSVNEVYIICLTRL